MYNSLEADIKSLQLRFLNVCYIQFVWYVELQGYN